MAFIEPVPQNDAVFSLQLAKQLLAICAQFETICRLRVAEVNPQSNARNMNGFYPELLDVQAAFQQCLGYAPNNEGTYLPIRGVE